MTLGAGVDTAVGANAGAITAGGGGEAGKNDESFAAADEQVIASCGGIEERKNEQKEVEIGREGVGNGKTTWPEHGLEVIMQPQLQQEFEVARGILEDENVATRVECENCPTNLIQDNESCYFTEANDELQSCDLPKLCILETQLNSQNDNKNASYLAMLAKIGLDSPTKSLDTKDNINKEGHNLAMVGGQRKIGMHKPACPNMASRMSQQGIFFKKGNVRKNKGKITPWEKIGQHLKRK